MSNIAKSGSSDDFDDEADHVLALNLQTGMLESKRIEFKFMSFSVS